MKSCQLKRYSDFISQCHDCYWSDDLECNSCKKSVCGGHSKKCEKCNNTICDQCYNQYYEFKTGYKKLFCNDCYDTICDNKGK